jgi:hypothetical protein
MVKSLARRFAGENCAQFKPPSQSGQSTEYNASLASMMRRGSTNSSDGTRKTGAT